VEAELYSRLARASILPLLPLLALPLGMTSRRAGRVPALLAGVLLLFAIQYKLQLGRSLAESRHLDPTVAIGGPFLAFAATCLLTFLTSRHRPGETPIGWLVERSSDVARRAGWPGRRVATAQASGDPRTI
jgi:lipopolysaccharide export system permease protein